MASIETALVAILDAASGLTALTGKRIYSPLAPQGAVTPYVTYYEISAWSEHAMGGRTILRECHYAFEAWADTAAVALSIADQIETALDGYSGTSDTVAIHYIQIRPSGGPPYDPESGLYRRLREFDIEFVRT